MNKNVKIAAKELSRLAKNLIASSMNGEIEFEVVRYKNSNGELITKKEYDKLSQEEKNSYSMTKIELLVKYNGEYDDFGIGPYEYWGIKGVDHEWRFELEDITSITDEDGNDWSDKLTSDESDRLDEECTEDGEKSFHDMQEFYNDMAREDHEND